MKHMKTLSSRIFSLVFVFALMGQLVGPVAVEAATSSNLVVNNWSLSGQVERVGQDLFTLRETGSTRATAFQNIPVSSDNGKRVLLISYTYTDRTNANGDITGLPYLYGYAMRTDGKIDSYLQGKALRHSIDSPGRWVVTYKTFSVPSTTSNLRLFLNQASRRGTVKDGRSASFYRPGVFVANTDRELRAIVSDYQSKLGLVPFLVIPPAPTPIPPPITTVAPYFDTVFNGYGSVTYSTGPTVVLSPKVSTTPSETHAALITSRESFSGNYETRFTLTNISQLRTGSTPNPWEVAWFVLGYKPDTTFKYVILKPEGYGVEFGEFLAAGGQNFLWTSPFGAENFPLNRSFDVRVRVENGVVTLVVDGVVRMRYTMSAKDRLTANGKIGFYTEDATVKIENITVRSI